jgi:hypothetical protein
MSSAPYSLLPPNATGLERNLATVGARIDDIPVPLATLKGLQPIGRKVSAGTVNRVIGVLKAVLNTAVE